MNPIFFGVFKPREWAVGLAQSQKKHAACWREEEIKPTIAHRLRDCNWTKADRATRTPGEQDKNEKVERRTQPRESWKQICHGYTVMSKISWSAAEIALS